MRYYSEQSFACLQIIDEWTAQVRAKKGKNAIICLYQSNKNTSFLYIFLKKISGDEDDAAEDINKMLFSAIVQNN